MLNAPLNIGRMPKTSSNIPIGAITKAIFAYVNALLQVADRLGPIPVAAALQSMTLEVMASYRIKAMKRNKIEITIPITPIPIGII
jgi:hypothetical protein